MTISVAATAYRRDMNSEADEVEPATPAPVDAVSVPDPHRPRRITTVVLVVLAVVLFLTSTIAVWAKRTVLDPNRVVAAVDRAASDPAVVDALAVKVTDQLVQLVDVNTMLEGVLPSQLDKLAPVISAALRDIVEKQVTAVVGSDAGRKLLTDAVRVAHATAIRLLEGDGLAPDSVFSIVDGQVTLDVVPLVVRTVEQLQANGIISDRFDLTELAQNVTSDVRVKILARIFGVSVPENFGQIVLIDSQKVDQGAATLSTAQRALAVFQRGTVLLVILALALLAAALFVSVDRRRTLAQLTLGIGIGAVLLRIGIDQVVSVLNRTIDAVGIRHAAVNITESLTSSLARTLVILAIVGIVVGILVRMLRPSADGTHSWLALLVRDHAEIARMVVIGLSLFLLAAVGISWLSVVLIGALAVAGVLYVNRNAASPALIETPAT